MFTLTDAAYARLDAIVDEKQLDEGTATRIIHDDSVLAMRWDNELPGDSAFEHEGRTVLLLDELVVNILKNETLDVDRQGFKLRRNPNGLQNR
jgi:hypothetical protein